MPLQEFAQSRKQSTLEVATNGYILRQVDINTGENTITLCPTFTAVVKEIAVGNGNLGIPEKDKLLLTVGP